MLNEEDKNIQLPECHTWYLVHSTSYKKKQKTPYYSNSILGTLYFVLGTATLYFIQNPYICIEMKYNAATLTFSLPAQVHHLLHHFHHSS
jgi:hypothetical protein